ncbi:MAG: hypothetical protein RJA22_113 [Verrucomicrobiota bacterium]
MKLILKRILLAVLIVPILIILAAFLLPSHYRVERTIDIQAAPETLSPWLLQLRRWPEWTLWNTNRDASLVCTFSGPAEGVGSAMGWTSRAGQGVLTLTEANPRSGLRYDLNFEQGKLLVQGGITLTPTPSGGTAATWFNEGSLGFNPVARYLGLLMDKMMGAELQQNLERLKEKAEKKAGP